jgi:hypothetical protein
MKYLLVALLFSAPLCAQSTSTDRNVQPTAQPTVGCASANVEFNVKKDDMHHDLPQPAAGKAQIVFIHDSGGAVGIGYPTTRLAMDGAWVGANHDDTWFAVSVEPGVHHFCVSLQSNLVGDRVELAHLNALPGGVYYYRTRLIMSRQVELLQLEPIDSDEGNYLLDQFAMSVSKPKK